MQELAQARHEKRVGDTLLLLEHEPVITLGRARQARERPLARSAARARGASISPKPAAGGDVTYHGPGQLVAYPILDLEARSLRRAPLRGRSHRGDACASSKTFGIEAGRRPGKIGAWVDRASVGAFPWPGDESARCSPRSAPSASALALDHDARLRAQRDDRSLGLRPHRALRHRRSRGHVDRRARGRARRRSRMSRAVACSIFAEVFAADVSTDDTTPSRRASCRSTGLRAGAALSSSCWPARAPRRRLAASARTSARSCSRGRPRALRATRRARPQNRRARRA